MRLQEEALSRVLVLVVGLALVQEAACCLTICGAHCTKCSDGTEPAKQVNGNCYELSCPDCSFTGVSFGSWCSENEDTDECSTNVHNCASQGSCANTDGSFTCTCGTGYETSDSGVTCTDIDECSTNVHNCASQGSCANTDGSFTCTCGTGYETSDSGVTCIQDGQGATLVTSTVSLEGVTAATLDKAAFSTGIAHLIGVTTDQVTIHKVADGVARRTSPSTSVEYSVQVGSSALSDVISTLGSSSSISTALLAVGVPTTGVHDPVDLFTHPHQHLSFTVLATREHLVLFSDTFDGHISVVDHLTVG